jgi:hypothetical protein
MEPLTPLKDKPSIYWVMDRFMVMIPFNSGYWFPLINYGN